MPGWRRLRGWEGRTDGQAPGAKAASGGLMVMVMVQPGWSFCIWRSSQACFCCGIRAGRRSPRPAPGRASRS